MTSISTPFGYGRWTADGLSIFGQKMRQLECRVGGRRVIDVRKKDFSGVLNVFFAIFSFS